MTLLVKLGHLWAIYGHIWTIYGHIWTIYGHIWAIYGHIWTIYGHIWAIYAHICPYMDHIWPYMSIYGHIWPFLGPKLASYGPGTIIERSGLKFCPVLVPITSQSDFVVRFYDQITVEKLRFLLVRSTSPYMASYGHMWTYMSMYMAMYGHI